MSHSRTLIPFENQLLEPFGWFRVLQQHLGYANLPMRLRVALENQHRKNRSKSYHIRYADSSPIWQRYFWGRLISDEPSARENARRQECLQELEMWLSQVLGKPGQFVTVSIEGGARPPISNDLSVNNGKQGLTFSLLRTARQNIARGHFFGDQSFRNWFRWAMNGLDCEISIDEFETPPAGKFYLRCIEPDIALRWPLIQENFELGRHAFEKKGWPGQRPISWSDSFPLLDEQHATLHWAGKRFWLQSHSSSISYTFSGEHWEWLGPLEARPLPCDKNEHAGQWFILLGHLNEFQQPLPGSVIMEFCYV